MVVVIPPGVFIEGVAPADLFSDSLLRLSDKFDPARPWSAPGYPPLSSCPLIWVYGGQSSWNLLCRESSLALILRTLPRGRVQGEVPGALEVEILPAGPRSG